MVIGVATVLLLGTLLVVGDRAGAHTGQWIDSSWTTSPPTIDGAMGAGEWADATTIDLAAIPGNMLPAYLLVKNDATLVYLAYDAVGDGTADTMDGASVAFDTGHDAIMSFDAEDVFIWGGPALNGEEHDVSDGVFWMLDCSPFDTGLPNHAGLASGYGFGPSDLSVGDHRIYELSIPLALLGVGPGEVIGLLGASYYMPGVLDEVGFTYSTWPVYMMGPPALDGYGDLRLGQPPAVDDLDINPPSQSARTIGGSALYNVTVVNMGTGNDLFDLTVASLWMVTLLDATGMTLLPDTDGDGTPDTGVMPSGSTFAFAARVDLPPTPSGCDDATVVGASNNTPTVTDFALLHTCVPPAMLSPPHADQGIDTDMPANGLFDVLQVDVSVLVTMDGFYETDILLMDQSGSIGITTGWDIGFYVAGLNTIPIPLAGLDIYNSGVDGPYLAEIYLYDDMFNLLDQGSHMTQAYNYTQFDPPAALFNPPHWDFGLDTDTPPDGLYDFLVIDANVTVAEAGTFTVSAGLFDSGLITLISVTGVDVYLGTGNQSVEVRFPGRDIFNSGIDGPFVAMLILIQGGMTLDTNMHNTGFYASTEFEPPGALFSPPHSDHGLDLTVPPDGRYEFLEIDVSVGVTHAGEYQIDLNLWDSTYSYFILSASTTVDLGIGTQSVPVLLDGIVLRQSGYDGPYVAELYLSDDFGTLDFDLYTTDPYSATDFAGPGASFSPPHSGYLIDSDVPPDGLADWLGVDAGVNVVIPGAYTVTAVLTDSGNYFLGVDSDCGVLPVGRQMCPLAFDGHAIAEWGVDGPYYVTMRLYDEYGRYLGMDTYVTQAYAASEFEPNDAAPPTATLAPLPAFVNGPVALDFSASDAPPTDGLESVTVYYRFSLDNSTWGPWTSHLTVSVSGPTASGSVPFAFSGGSGYYEFQATATDVFGNAESLGLAEARTAYRLDVTAPTATVAPLPAWKNGPVSLDYAASDPLPASGLASVTIHYRFSTDNSSWGPWTFYLTIAISGTTASGSLPFVFADGTGYYEFQATAVDMFGNAEPLGAAEARTLFRAPDSLRFTPTVVGLTAGRQTTVAVEVLGDDGLPATLESNLVVSLATTSAGGVFREVGTVNPITFVTIAAGQSSASFDYYDVRAGSWALRASSGRTADAIATANVSPDDPISVIVTPSIVTVEVVTSQSFTATAYDQFANPVAVAFTWTADAVLGSIDASGTLNAATMANSGTVTAEAVGWPGITGSAAVTLIHAAADHIDVTPSTRVLSVDQTQTFSATVRDQFGNVVTGASVTWSVVGGIGSVDVSGDFTAGPVVGTGQVVASFGSVSGSASVTVNPGPVTALSIVPGSANITVGATQTFTAVARDHCGNVNTTASVAWATTGSVGVVDASGVFTAATTVRTGQVIASSGSVQAVVWITLRPGPVVAIEIHPGFASVAWNTDVDLVAIAVDSYGNGIANASVTWTVTSGSGTLSANTGMATTLKVTGVGTTVVTAASGPFSDTATFTVIESGTGAVGVAGVGIGGLLGGLIVGIILGRVLARKKEAPEEPAEEAAEEEEAEGAAEEATEEEKT